MPATMLRIIFMRGEEHNDNRITRAGDMNAGRVGTCLLHHDLLPDFFLSSPEPRCVSTALAVMQGLNRMYPLRTDDRLGDASMGKTNMTDQAILSLRAMAAERGITPQKFLLENTAYRQMLHERGSEGAKAVLDLMYSYPDRNTYFICSHHGSRLEPMWCELLQRSIHKLKSPFEGYGSVAVIEKTGRDRPFKSIPFELPARLSLPQVN